MWIELIQVSEHPYCLERISLNTEDVRELKEAPIFSQLIWDGDHIPGLCAEAGLSIVKLVKKDGTIHHIIGHNLEQLTETFNQKD